MEDIFKFLLIAGIIVISFVRQAKKEAKKKAGNNPAMPVFDEENPLPESWNDGTYGGYIPESPKPEAAVIRKKTEKKNISPPRNSLSFSKIPTIHFPNLPTPHPNLKYTRQRKRARLSSGERYYNENINAIES